MFEGLWIALKPSELIFIGGVWVALLVLSVQSRLSYLIAEANLSDRQQGRCRPDLDIIRRTRLWSAISLIGTCCAILSLSKPIYENGNLLCINLSSLMFTVSFLMFTIAYIRYLVETYIIDYLADTIYVQTIFLRQR